MVRKVYEGYLKKDLESKRVSKSISKPEIETVYTPNVSNNEAVKKSPIVAPFATKTVTSKPISKKHSKPSIALFIDVDNVGISRENLLEVLFFINGKFKIEVCKLYGYDESTLPGIKEVASNYNLTTLGKMQFKPSGKNFLDSRLLIDAYECAIKNANSIDTIFVWCFPCDLSSLFEKIIELGISTATIDNPVFDCKNKYVSQVIKLYSKYEFTVDDYMYGNLNTVSPKVDTTMDEDPHPQIENSFKIDVQPEQPKTVPSIKLENNNSITAEKTSISKPMPPVDTLDGSSIPVLPKRSIPERTGKPKTADINLQNTELDSLKNDFFNIEDSFTNRDNLEDDSDKLSILEVLQDVILDEEPKEKKYEDTIGDL